MPVCSVGLPVYNAERFVRNAIESVLAQTFEDFELVICDNASTDATERICREYAARDRRVNYFRNEVNLGGSGNFCRVFERSAARYFRWLAADDSMAPRALQACFTALEADAGAVLACGRAAFVGEAGDVIAPYDEPQALPQRSAVERFRAVTKQDPQCHALYGLMRREALERTRLLGPFAGSDNTFLAEVSLYGRFIEIDELLFFRRVHPGAYSWNMSDERVRAFYAPSQRDAAGVLLSAMRHRSENVRAVLRAPVTSVEKLRLLAYVARQAWWQRAQFRQELRSALRAQPRPQRSQG